MIAEGATNTEIAERLVIAPSTVESHVKRILRKLGARNRTEAAARYLRG
jgi:DNA-binding NarL/FixJ family response regulator